MRRWILRCAPIFLVLVAAGAASGTPCAVGTLQSYLDLGAPCSAGIVDFSGFTLAPGQSFATLVDPTAIQVTPSAMPGGATLTLTFSTNAAAGDLLESFFRFTASAGVLLSGGISISGASATGDGVVTAIQDFCADGSFSGNAPLGCSGSAATIITFLTASDSTLSEAATFASVASLDVFTDVVIDGALAGTAGLESVTLSFVVPEPSTALLLALGLVLVTRVARSPACRPR